MLHHCFFSSSSFFFYAKNYQEAIRVLFLFLKSYQPSSTYSCHSTRPAISGLEMGQLEKGEWGKFPTGEAIYSLIREGNRHFFPLKTEKKKIKPDTAQPWLSWRWSMRSSRCCFLGTGFICSHAALLQIDFGNSGYYCTGLCLDRYSGVFI